MEERLTTQQKLVKCLFLVVGYKIILIENINQSNYQLGCYVLFHWFTEIFTLVRVEYRPVGIQLYYF